MPKDQSYLEAEQKIPTMIEGLQDYPDFKNQVNPNHGNQVNQANQG
jgi:hypothetical protein